MKNTEPANQQFILSRRMVFNLFIALGMIWIIYLYRSVLSSLILGALLAYILQPMAKLLHQKVRLSYKISAWAVFLTFLLALISLTRFSAPIVIKQVNTLASDFQQISDELIGLQPMLDNALNINLPLKEIIAEFENEINQVVALRVQRKGQP